VAFETPEGDKYGYLTVDFEDLDDARLFWNEGRRSPFVVKGLSREEIEDRWQKLNLKEK
jgi:hypothetical protein